MTPAMRRFMAEVEAATPGAATGTRGHFGSESRELTVTWGNTTNVSFTPGVGGEAVQQLSQQLIQVATRPRPTNFSLLTLITLGQGWTGETGPWTFVVVVNVGVGQAVARINRPFTIPGTSLLNGGQVVLDQFFGFPAAAISAQVAHFGTAVNVGVAHDFQVTQLAAPVVQ